MILLNSISSLAVIIALQISYTLGIPLDADTIVQTPAGPFPRSNTHQIPSDSHIQLTNTTVSIVTSNGTTLHRFPITEKGPKLIPGNVGSSLSPRALQNGYVASSYWGNVDTSPLQYFATSWEVPAIPENVDGQVLFMFNGLEPNSFESILQPVLQFGGGSAAGGGNYWAVASWFVAPVGVFYTPLTTMYPGQILKGVITLQSTQTSDGGVTTYNYNTMFSRLPKSSLNISTTDQLAVAFEALEIYAASGPTDLPRGRTAMKNINMIEQNGQRPVLNWGSFNDGDEGFQVVIVTDGATNGEVDLIYPLQ